MKKLTQKATILALVGLSSATLQAQERYRFQVNGQTKTTGEKVQPYLQYGTAAVALSGSGYLGYRASVDANEARRVRNEGRSLLRDDRARPENWGQSVRPEQSAYAAYQNVVRGDEVEVKYVLGPEDSKQAALNDVRSEINNFREEISRADRDYGAAMTRTHVNRYNPSKQITESVFVGPDIQGMADTASRKNIAENGLRLAEQNLRSLEDRPANEFKPAQRTSTYDTRDSKEYEKLSDKIRDIESRGGQVLKIAKTDAKAVLVSEAASSRALMKGIGAAAIGAVGLIEAITGIGSKTLTGTEID